MGVANAQVTTLDVDSEASVINWKGGKKVIVNDTHHGTVKVRSGSVEVNAAGEIVGGEIVIDMKSIKNKDLELPSSSDKLDAHLKSSDFFDVEQYPEARFVIKEIKKESEPKGRGKKADKAKKNEDGQKYLATGEMTIKDKTHKETVTLIVTKQAEADYRIKSTFEIDRARYNVKYNSEKFFKNLGDKIIKDELEISLALKTKKKAKTK